MYGFNHDWMFDGTGGWMILGWVWMALVWLVPLLILLALLKYLIGNRGPRPPHAPPSRRARDLLDEAYARGEINREEYLQKREDLSRTG